jgi:hypothetical protein
VGISLLILSDEVFDSQRVGGLQSRLNCRAVGKAWLEVQNQQSRLTRLT